MSEAHTFEAFDYRFRPVRNVERNMICEALGRFSGAGRIHRYRYVAFSGVGFNDFALFHHKLGIADMIGIEEREEAASRLLRNRPYACIKLRFGSSSLAELRKLSWRKPSVVWLDYSDQELSEAVITEIALVTSKLKSGSILLVSVRADTEGHPRLHVKSLLKFTDETLLSRDLKAADLSKWKYASVVASILSNQVRQTLADRNGALTENNRLRFRQLFHFNYHDPLRTLTFGGLFVDENDAATFDVDRLDGLGFVRGEGADPFEIKIPVLTLREIKYLDSLLPNRGMDQRNPTWIPLLERRLYRDIYRYFPHFHELEAS